MTALCFSFSRSCAVTRNGFAPGTVGLVDEGEPRDVVAAHLPVDGHRLRLHAGDGAQHEDRPVEHPQRPLDLDREVDVARRVDDVDEVVVPLAVRRGGLDRDAALALQVHRVHLRPDAVLALDVVDDADSLRVEKNALGQCRLAGIDVRADSDVSYPLQIADHYNSLRIETALPLSSSGRALVS